MKSLQVIKGWPFNMLIVVMAQGGKNSTYFYFLHYNSLYYMNVYSESLTLGFPGGSDGKESTCNTGDADSTPGWGRSPDEGNGNPLQYSCSRIRGQRSLTGYSPWGRKGSGTTERLTLTKTWYKWRKFLLCVWNQRRKLDYLLGLILKGNRSRLEKPGNKNSPGN